MLAAGDREVLYLVKHCAIVSQTLCVTGWFLRQCRGSGRPVIIVSVLEVRELFWRQKLQDTRSPLACDE